MSASHHPTDIHLRQHRAKKRNKLRARIAAAPATGRAALEAKVQRTYSPFHSLMKEKPSASVEVVAPDWVRNSSGVTSGFWPAFEVEVSAGKPDASVKFVRVGYEPLPEGFRIPSTGGGENPPGQIAPPDTGDGGLR